MICVTKKLGQLGELLPGYQLRTAMEPNPAGRYALVRLGDVKRSADWSDLPRMDLDLSAERCQIIDGDVLCRSRGGNYQASVAEGIWMATVALAPLYIFRPDPSKVLAGYIAWWLNSFEAQAEIESAAVGTNIQTVPMRAFESLPIPVVPLELQAKMVEVHQLSWRIEELESTLAHKRSEFVERSLEELARRAP